MENKEMLSRVVARSSVEQALGKDDQSKGGKPTRSVSPEKSTTIAQVVQGSINNLLMSMTQPKCSYDNLDELQMRTVEYLQRCVDSQSIPLVEDWAVSLGVSRATLYRWFDNQSNREVFDFLERVRTSIYAANAQAAYKNAINCVSWIFYAKNSLGMTDKTSIEIAPQLPPMDDMVSPEELRRKYLEAIEG